MSTISFDLNRTGVIFRDAGLSINKRVEDNLQHLNSNDIQILLNKAQELLLISKTMFAKAVVQIGEETTNSFQSLVDAKSDIDEVIRRIKNVQSIIEISAKLVSTASAIISGDIPKIIANTHDVMTEVSNLLNQEQ